MLMIILGFMFGVFSALQTLSVFMLMVYSSLSYSSWLICGGLMGPSMYTIFLLFYCVIMWCVYLLVVAEDSVTMLRMMSFFTLSKSVVLGLFLAFFLLSGFPPSPLFFLKLNIVSFFIVNHWWVLGFSMMLFSVVGYFYNFRLLMGWFLLNTTKKFKLG